MPNPLKYSALLTEFNISHCCPFDSYVERRIEAYVWTYSPIEHALNFLPNFEYDKARNRPPRGFANMTNEAKCNKCCMSMFNSLESAVRRFNSYEARIQQLLGYTHVAQGVIEETDGLCSDISQNGHFQLFEYEGVNLATKFTIIQTLN